MQGGHSSVTGGLDLVIHSSCNIWSIWSRSDVIGFQYRDGWRLGLRHIDRREEAGIGSPDEE